MGVLNCDRKGCDNIMCDRLSHKYGYICSECFQELCNSDMDIEEFMKTPKIFKLNTHTYEEYDNEFKIRRY